ncbi:MAG: hypothetical protein NTZ85_08235 [Bacteroidia bacterium]|nr:hypothetical protein [Bacteroidia bacterium]
MKIFLKIIFVILICGCSKEIEITSIDQIPGKWQWGYTCGDIDTSYVCVYSSALHWATIDFTSDGKYIERHNDTIFLQTNYTLTKIDDSWGTLILENPAENRPIAIMNHQLLITRGSSIDSYMKMQ